MIAAAHIQPIAAPQAVPLSAAMKILVVEDNATDLKLLCDLLLADHHAVLATSSAEDALKLLEANEVDVVLVDLLLRGLDAFSFIRQVRHGAGGRHIPVIALSAQTRWPVERIAKGFSCAGFVRKPVDPLQLSTLLAAAVRQI